MIKKEINNAENHLVVGSLEVLGNIKGSGFDSMKKAIATLNNVTSTLSQKQDKYYEDIVSDNVVTPIEKKILKKEWEQIVQVHTAINTIALDKGLNNTPVIASYNLAFQKLRAYLFENLHIFDNMNENTEINDAVEFNQKYNNYYEAETYAQGALTGEIPAFYSMRISTSSIKKTTTGYDPGRIKAEKKVQTTTGEEDTNYGVITATIKPSGDIIEVGSWKQEDKTEYDANRIYGKRMLPVFLKANGIPIYAEENTIGILFQRSK